MPGDNQQIPGKGPSAGHVADLVVGHDWDVTVEVDARGANEPKGWAASRAEVDDRIAIANEMVGKTLCRVRYFTIDYHGLNHPEIVTSELRRITSDDEWAQSPWNRTGGHALDYGVDLEFSGGQTFAVTWDPPGNTESLRVTAGSLASSVHARSGNAVWDVTEVEPWRSIVGLAIERVQLDYEPWSEESGFWCVRAALLVAEHEIQFVLSDMDSDGNFLESSDNVVVVSARSVEAH